MDLPAAAEAGEHPAAPIPGVEAPNPGAVDLENDPALVAPRDPAAAAPAAAPPPAADQATTVSSPPSSSDIFSLRDTSAIVLSDLCANKTLSLALLKRDLSKVTPSKCVMLLSRRSIPGANKRVRHSLSASRLLPNVYRSS